MADLKSSMLRFLMRRRSRVGQIDSTWKGYTLARNAKTDTERDEALLSISQQRYEESMWAPLDGYFRTDLRSLLKGKDVLDIGCNHGGATLAYFEKYGLHTITGLEISRSQIDIAARFFALRGVAPDRYRFFEGFAEALPFEAESFDAIISFDVWEHVSDAAGATRECFRVLRPGGLLLLVFPSYYHPTQHHLFEVTQMPFLHWFFRPSDIMDTYWEILDAHPEYRDQIGVLRRPLEPWEKLRGINGLTLADFRRIVQRDPWSLRQFIPLPFGMAGTAVGRHPILKLLRWLSAPATRLPGLNEAANQRIVCILTR